MGSSLPASDLLDAAQRVSSAKVGSSRGAGGSRSTDAEWEAMRGKLARALVADPDLVTYFAYLVSNRACLLAQQVAKVLSSMVVSVEGWKFEQDTPATPDRLNRVLTAVSGRSTLSSEDVSRLTTEIKAYIEAELLPKVTKGSRLQVKGTTAVTTYSSARATLLPLWRKMFDALDATTDRRDFVLADVRNVALRVPVDALEATAALSDPTQLVEFTVQLAAAGAAVEAMGREVDLQTRLQTYAPVFPPETSARTTDTLTDGYVTTIAISVSPVALGIRSGDTVVAASGGSADVRTVSDTEITLGSSTITSTATGVAVKSTAYLQWKALCEELTPTYSALPLTETFLKQIQQREDRSAARIRALMEFLCKNAVVLDAASSDATAALDRVGGELYVPSGASAATLLRNFAPFFSARTKRAGDRLLQELEGGGFDHAVELLYRGRITELMTAQASQMSRSGRLDDVVATLSAYTGGLRGVG